MAPNTHDWPATRAPEADSMHSSIPRPNRTGVPRRPGSLIALVAAALLVPGATALAQRAPAPPQPAGGEIRLLFLLGSEKKAWIAAVTQEFNNKKVTLPRTGERIFVEAVPDGSNIIVTDALKGESRKPHLISPASRAFLIDANGRAAEEGQPDVVDLGKVRELARSPLVIAMWREVAEAMGWPGQPIGWRDFYDNVANPNKWVAIRKKAAWGKLKYGHTHPDYSNSGLEAVLAEFMAGTNQFDLNKVGPAGLKAPEVVDFVRRVEAATVHYGESTGFFAEKMFAKGGGRKYLTAAILYENLVYEANKNYEADGKLAGGQPEVVAIYPAEGTFSNDHPIGVVERPWVSPKEREAAQIYINHLLAEPQQRRAIESGLRPISPGLNAEVTSAFLPKYGVDPSQPTAELQFPSYSVIKQARTLWRRKKRPADVVLAIDTSGSMVGEKIARAEEAAKQFIGQLSDGDTLLPILFSTNADDPRDPFKMDEAGKKAAMNDIDGIDAGGATALYQAVSKAFDHLSKKADTEHNRAVVLLSDGKDTQGGIARDDLLRLIENDGERNIYVITIGYGDGNDLDPETLKAMAEKTKAKYYKADPKTIRKDLREIVTFF